MEEKKKRPGPQRVKPVDNDKAKGFNVSMKPSVERAIVEKYGSLSKAIKALYNSIPNEAAFKINQN